MDVVIERSKIAVEGFFCVPGSAVMPFYGRAPVGLTDANGIVPVKKSREQHSSMAQACLPSNSSVLSLKVNYIDN